MTVDPLRQLRLLLQKDLLLARRAKVWFVFQLLIPVLLLYPVAWFVIKNKQVTESPAITHGSFYIFGNSSDIDSEMKRKRFCMRDEASVAYSWSQGVDKSAAQDLIKRIISRYKENFKLNAVEFRNEEEMREHLIEDIKNVSFCSTNRFIAGINIETMTEAMFAYRILMHDAPGDSWHLDDDWDAPYGNGNTKSRPGQKYPFAPPYWYSGFISLQHAIELEFYQVSKEKEFPLIYTGLPVPSYRISSVAAFVKYWSLMLSIGAFLIVLHCAREITAEKAFVKPYLSAMGLSTMVFYLSHCIFAFLKASIVLLPVSAFFAYNAQYISVPIFLIITVTYTLAAVSLAALVASICNTSSAAIKVMIFVWGGLLGVALKFAPSRNNPWKCILACFNLHGALDLAMTSVSDFVDREADTVILGDKVPFPFIGTIFMLLFDAFWMMGAAWAIDKFKSNGCSLAWLFEKFSNKEYADAQEICATDGRLEDGTLLIDLDEVDGARNRAQADIEVNNLLKVWPSTGERAVDGFSLKAVKGQVAVLLGHNGAGKSTTFACITGIENPTRGTVKIRNHNMASDRWVGRWYLGLCPQYNPLYDKLTVMEHLELIHGLKGSSQGSYKSEAVELLRKVKLIEKSDVLAMNLSGGMKRKLCVCMSLIGDSKVVLLDEPTAGMDPGARKDVQDLLEAEKGHRTILLTTHYMNEAERLGDFIYIMSHGRGIASGSGQHLKTKFGTGFVLTVVLDQAHLQSVDQLGSDLQSNSEHRLRKIEEGENRKRAISLLMGVCEAIIPDAKLGERHGNQVEISLPEAQKKLFGRLFTVLEAIKDGQPIQERLPKDVLEGIAAHELPISTFGVALNTLEQVFIRIGVIGENVNRSLNRDTSQPALPAYGTQLSTKSVDSYRKMNETSRRLSGLSLVLSQIRAILYKRFLYTWRNKTQLFGQILVPLVLFVGVALALMHFITRGEASSFNAKKLGLLDFGSGTILFHASNATVEKFRHMTERYRSLNGYSTSMEEPLMSVMQRTIGLMPPIAFGVSTYRETELEVLFNYRAYHSLPTVKSLMTRAFYNSNVTLIPSIGLFSYRSGGDSKFDSSSLQFVFAPFLVLVFAMITSTFVIFLIEERTNKFTHQQTLTGISPVVYWLASFLYDLVFYTVAVLVYLAVFAAFGWMRDYIPTLALFLYLYFLASVPFIYIISNIFSSSSKANVLLVIWQVVICLAAMFFLLLITPILNLPNGVESAIKGALTFLLPSFAFGNAIGQIAIANVMGVTNWQMLEWDRLGKSAVLMSIFSVLCTVLFIAFQFKYVRMVLKAAWNRHVCGDVSTVDTYQPNDVPHCAQVAEEEALVRSGDLQEHVLVVEKLNKSYGRLRAVNDLYLAVKQNECFGLLGVNGAGKTTTFDMLTGQSFATSGAAVIDGKPVHDQIAIGYCPQFDALMPEFTARQTLEILALMYGFVDWRQKVAGVLECVAMTEHADKIVRCLSGGQKRKISMGVALMAPTKIIILDEPTAGIDPMARRGLWDLLLWIREHVNSAILLTSHSMEECEALCSRIGVLNRGKLIAIGTSQDLKSLYGNSYSLSMTLYEEADRDRVCQTVTAILPGSILKTKETSKTMTLQWQLPKNKNDKWSTKYEKIERMAETLRVKDYCLTQTSLEDTFLSLSGVENESPTNTLER